MYGRGGRPHTRFRKRNVYGRGRRTTYTFQEEKRVWPGETDHIHVSGREMCMAGRQTKYTFQEEKRVWPGEADQIHVSGRETCTAAVWPRRFHTRFQSRNVYMACVPRLCRGTDCVPRLGRSTGSRYEVDTDQIHASALAPGLLLDPCSVQLARTAPHPRPHTLTLPLRA